jgi:hypothetical protein
MTGVERIAAGGVNMKRNEWESRYNYRENKSDSRLCRYCRHLAYKNNAPICIKLRCETGASVINRRYVCDYFDRVNE